MSVKSTSGTGSPFWRLTKSLKCPVLAVYVQSVWLPKYEPRHQAEVGTLFAATDVGP